MKRSLLFSILIIAAFSSCRKKPDPVVTPAGNGSMKITVTNVAGNQQLILDSLWYQNANGDSFKVSLYKYYISNIVLTREDGAEFAEPMSYHLINEAVPSTKSFIIDDVPAGNYSKVQFMIGVDSARNMAGAGTGDLDPLYGMSWDWNTGYIAAKLEGYSPRVPNPDHKVVFHIGGYKGQYKVMRDVSLMLPSLAVTNASETPNIHMKADILEWFKTPSPIDLGIFYHAMDPGKDVSKIADNYSDMFKVDHVD